MRTGLLFNLLLGQNQTPADIYTEALEQAEIADEIGFDSLWVGESHFNEKEPIPQPQTMLNAFASVTKGVRLGTMGKVLALDNPIRVAEDYALLDITSNGRVVLGAAVGNDAEAFGHYKVSFDDREERFKEYIDIIRKSWTCDGFSYTGKFYQFPSNIAPAEDEASFEREPYKPPQIDQWQRAGQPISYLPMIPKGVQLPHLPIWIQSSSTEMLSYAARSGYSYLPSFLESDEKLKERVRYYRQELEAAGRDVTEVEWPVIRVCYVTESSEAARSDVEGPLNALFEHYAETGQLATAEGADVPAENLSYEKLIAERAIVGSVEEVVDRIKQLYEEVGTNHFIACMALPGLSHDKVIKSITLFNQDVWSRLQY